MQVETKDNVHVMLEGPMEELMATIEPKLYRKYIIMPNKTPILYVRLRKSLYGTLNAALLFWQYLSDKFRTWGFTTNKYDTCVMNKIINGNPCTILWHVDDIKISHRDPDTVSSIVGLLQGEFGKDEDITVRRGKVHNYLGMTITYRRNNEVEISMVDYMTKLLEEVPETMIGDAKTPEAEFLFKVNIDEENLGDGAAQEFHHIVARLLFISKRARPDIQTAVAFLCTRVKEPDADDWKKLTWLVMYINATRKLTLILKGTEDMTLSWWVDGSYAVHNDMRSHSGGMLSLGHG